MCWSCLRENMDEGEEVVVTDAMRALAVMIRDFYDLPGCSVGGPLHVVLDDCNVEDEFLRVWEPWWMPDDGAWWTPERVAIEFPRDERVLPAAEAIIEAMLPLSENERMASIELAWAARPFTSVVCRSATLHINTEEDS